MLICIDIWKEDYSSNLMRCYLGIYRKRSVNKSKYFFFPFRNCTYVLIYFKNGLFKKCRTCILVDKYVIKERNRGQITKSYSISMNM